MRRKRNSKEEDPLIIMSMIDRLRWPYLRRRERNIPEVPFRRMSALYPVSPVPIKCTRYKDPFCDASCLSRARDMS